MRFRHSIHLTIDNFSSTFKLLLYKLVVGIILGSIAYVIIKLGLAVIVDSAEAKSIGSLISSFLNALFTGKTEVLQSFPGDIKDALQALLNLISAKAGIVAGCAVGLVLLYLFSRFVNGLAVFATGITLNDRMSVYSRTKFSQAYFKGIGSAALYQAIYVPLCFLYDALMFALCWLVFFYVPSLLPAWGFVSFLVSTALALTAVFCMEALKMTLISTWMPAIIADGEKVGAAFRASVKCRKGFASRFSSFLVGIYVIFIVNVLCAVATLGSALLITLPLSYLFLLSIQFVSYYRGTEKKYFVSLRRIEGGQDKPEGLNE